MRIALAEDHFLNRKILRQKILPYSEIEIVLEAENGAEFVSGLQQLDTLLHPHVALIDLEMPVLNGIDTIATVSRRFPHIKLLVLTIFEDYDKIFTAICHGACGYLVKEDNGARTAEGLQTALHYGALPMSPAIARRTLQFFSSAELSGFGDLDSRLLPAETQYLKASIEGNTFPEIADEHEGGMASLYKTLTDIYRKMHTTAHLQLQFNTAKSQH